MNLSINAFFRFMFHEKGTYEYEDQINRAIYYESSAKMRLAVIAGAILQSVLFLGTVSNPKSYGIYIVYYRALYVALFLLCVISWLILLYVKNDYEKRSAKLLWIAPIVAFLIVSGALFESLLDSLNGGFANPIVYMTVVLLIPLCMYMHPVMYVLVMFFTDTVAIFTHYQLRERLGTSSPSTITFVLYLMLELVLGLVVLFLEFSFRENNINNEIQKREISDLNNAQNRFFSSMSHEIRTPINTIIGLNEMILREKVSDEVAEDAVNIRAASNMLLHLINDILDMSKISSGQMKLTPVNYHPGDMLSEIVGMLWLRAREKGLDFHIELAPDIPSELYGDEVRIKQILINVLNNAIKYTQKGSVTLSIQCNGINKGVADIVYSVKDTGVGIRKESLPHLFTAFKRVDEEENRYIEGTGLGLSIVKELTELMGGKVTVNSVYTQGSTFVIEIPQTVTDFTVIKDINFEERHRAVNMSGSYRCSFEAKDAKVLVVDDNESNLMVAQKLLRDTKVQIDTASSGAAALEKTLEKSYDVILMDHLMPNMDGVECLRHIRNQAGGLNRTTPIIVLTANAGSDNRDLYARAGFDGYLVKPVSGDALEKALMKHISADKLVLSDSIKSMSEDINASSGYSGKTSVVI